ncbi:MAG TPA: hypothetical protein VGS79_27190 [Puia sp.]|nr:hypothetical protein [Puia sp.]
MEWEIYELRITDDGLGYWFISEGSRGRIKKVIEFQWVPGLGTSTFNLAFGDFIEGSYRLDDKSVSNSRDRLKVLHTVSAATMEFLEGHSRSIILIRANTIPRARLYQMMISSVWNDIREKCEVCGKHGIHWLPFIKGLNYSEFLVYKKIK